VTDCIFGGSFSFPFPTSLSLSPSCDLACFSGASPSLPWCFTGKRPGSCASLPLILWCLQKIVTAPYSFLSESLTCRPLLLLLPREFQKLVAVDVQEELFPARVGRCSKARIPNNCSLLTGFLPWLSPIISANQPCRPWRKLMEDFTELMQRLLEIQSGGRQRSPQLIAEHERLMDGLQKRSLAGQPTQTVRLSQDSAERVRFRA
jgi:hypothetical protein